MIVILANITYTNVFMNTDSVACVFKASLDSSSSFFKNVEQVSFKPNVSQSPYNSFSSPSFYRFVLNCENTQRNPKGPKDRGVRQCPVQRPAASRPRPTSQCVAFLDFWVKFCRQNAVNSKFEVLTGGGRGGSAMVGIRDQPRPGGWGLQASSPGWRRRLLLLRLLLLRWLLWVMVVVGG